MDARGFLTRLRTVDRSIALKQVEIMNLRTLAEGTTCATDGDRVQTSGSKDKVGNAVIQIVALQAELIQEITKMIEIRREICQVIDKVNDATLIEILYLKYLQHRSWVYIADELGISYQWVHSLHIKALNKVTEIMRDDINL